MSTARPLRTLAAKPIVASSSNATLLPQRKCACGSATSSLTGECAECGSKKVLQTKLAIGASNDPLENEADRVADYVMAAAKPGQSGAPPLIQRLTGRASEGTQIAPASVARVLRSPGTPLQSPLRQEMERRFRHDFSQVRIHAGAVAEQSARDVNANAYTVGQHVIFGTGRLAPETYQGRRLIAHELTHVVQQSSPAEYGVSHNHDHTSRPDAGDLSSGHPQAVQRETTQQEEEQRDEDRGDRRSTDSRRDRQKLGLMDVFDNFDSDWAGRMILGQWLYGGGRKVDVRDDPAWTAYMTKSDLLRKQVWVQVVAAANALAQQGKSGRRPTLTRFPAKLENGEGIIGYQYLHGTNEKAGDFFVVGFGEVTQFRAPHSAVILSRTPFAPPKLLQRGAGTRVDLDLTFIWNDIIDPNATYMSDKIKSAIANVFTLGQPENYHLSIGWRDSCSVWFPASGGQQLTGGYPAQ